MELNFETVLDVALGGPDIDQPNLHVLHGLMKMVFKKFGLLDEGLIVKENDPLFSKAYNFMKDIVDKDPEKTKVKSQNRERSKVSMIVSDYARSPIGRRFVVDDPVPFISEDIEDRIRYLESKLKIVQDFPSVDELRTWAKEKSNPDTVVTDLWHFINLNHRMGGAEEGIQKLTELVDKLIPELKNLNNEQQKIQNNIDDLNRHLQDLTKHIEDVDDRIDKAGEKAQNKVNNISDELKNIRDQFSGYAKLMDLEDFLLTETFIDEKNKARVLADKLQDDIASKVPLSVMDNFPTKDELKAMQDEIDKIGDRFKNVASKDELPDLDSYVNWPVLEKAFLDQLSIKHDSATQPLVDEYERPTSRLSISSSTEDGQLSLPEISQQRPYVICSSQGNSKEGNLQDGHSSSFARSDIGDEMQRGVSRNSSKDGQQLRYPTEPFLKKLHELSMLGERQNAIMDAIEAARAQLKEKADKSDLNGMLTQEDLEDLLKLLRDLRDEVNGLQGWREVVVKEEVPQLYKAVENLEDQLVDGANKIQDIVNDNKEKQDAINHLLSSISDLEERKLNKDDPSLSYYNPEETSMNLNETSTNLNERNTNLNDYPDLADEMVECDSNKTLDESVNDDIADIKKRLNELLENDFGKKLSTIMDQLDDKLDRSELEPLREYLENRYNILSQQDDQQQAKKDCSPEAKVNRASQRVFQTSPSIPHDGTTEFRKISPPSYASPRRVPNTHNLVPDTTECYHPHYGDGGFHPAKKEAAVFRTQMKFNCLSCDRPLTMQSNSHLQTIRGKPLNAYELDQLRLLQRILKGDKPKKPTRACGGKHTSGKRLTARISSSKSVPAMPVNGTDDRLLDGEVDIEGLDGRLYRGLVSKKDLNHLRSKSASGQLRTVSPRPRSGKSMDCASSFYSMDTPSGFVEIPVEE